MNHIKLTPHSRKILRDHLKVAIETTLLKGDGYNLQTGDGFLSFVKKIANKTYNVGKKIIKSPITKAVYTDFIKPIVIPLASAYIKSQYGGGLNPAGHSGNGLLLAGQVRRRTGRRPTKCNKKTKKKVGGSLTLTGKGKKKTGGALTLSGNGRCRRGCKHRYCKASKRARGLKC